MVINTDKNKINELLERGVDETIDKKHLKHALESGRRLRVKFGIDPTSPDLHLGHSIPLRKLKQFQDLGHQVIFLIGDFTAQIGDPSGRVSTRKLLTEEEIKENMAEYTNQAGKILNIKKIELRYNSEWYKPKGATFLMELASRFTFARLIERDDFKKRIKKDIDVSMLELMYPLLQGYDSVALKADVEIGGTDQKFNLLFGRKVQRRYNLPEQDIITLPLLIGTDGITKMSKSVGNCIKLTEEPEKMYAQIMSIPDELLWHYFNLLTDFPLERIKKMRDAVAKVILSPRDAKAQLAQKIVGMYHGKKAAQKAEDEFNKVFKKKGLPSQIPVFKTAKKVYPILDLLKDTGLADSKSEARRLVLSRGVKINEQLCNDWKAKIKLADKMVIKVGKRKFAQIKVLP